MNIIKNNPYRAVGLLVGSSAREQDRQVKRLKQFIEAEQDPQDDFSFPFIGQLHRTVDSVTDAASKLNLDSDKMYAALFWFWNGNPIIDEAAFDSLKDGDTETAYQIWDTLTTETKDDGKKVWKNITEKNYSAFHNSSVLSLITNKGAFVSAVVANIKFIESEYFDKFVKAAVDETYRVSKKDIQLNFLKTVFENIDNKRLENLVKYLNDYNFSAKADFLKSFVQKPIELIEQKIETAKNKRKASKANAAKAGQELLSAVANDLTQLKSIIGISDIQYISVADKLANEILQCSIDFFNYSQEKSSNDDYAEIAMQLAKQAQTISAGNLTKERIKDSINTLEEMKDREISQAIEALQSIKGAYEKNKAEMNAKVLSMPLGYNQTINWSKVEQMIENSLNWDKVVELIQQVIPPHNIDKIKNVKNQTTLNQYKSLVTFVVSKLSYFQKSKVRYISYWEAKGKVAVPTSGDIEKIPNWVKWVAGIIVLIILAKACG